MDTRCDLCDRPTNSDDTYLVIGPSSITHGVPGSADYMACDQCAEWANSVAKVGFDPVDVLAAIEEGE